MPQIAHWAEFYTFKLIKPVRGIETPSSGTLVGTSYSFKLIKPVRGIETAIAQRMPSVPKTFQIN